MSTIEKLNSSIASLQKTIQSLIQSNKTTKISAQPAMLAPSKSQVIPPFALSQVSGDYVKDSIAKLGNEVLKGINKQVNTLMHTMQVASKLTPIAQDYSKDNLPKPPPKFFSWQAPNFLPSQSRKPSQQFMQGVSLMAGSYILGGLSNLGSGQTWEESPVSKGIGAVAGAASSGMMAGGAAAMMGLGPVGIGLAAIVPVVQEFSKAIGEM